MPLDGELQFGPTGSLRVKAFESKQPQWPDQIWTKRQSAEHAIRGEQCLQANEQRTTWSTNPFECLEDIQRRALEAEQAMANRRRSLRTVNAVQCNSVHQPLVCLQLFADTANTVQSLSVEEKCFAHCFVRRSSSKNFLHSVYSPNR